MNQQGLSHFTDTHLTSLGLLIFFVFFICVLVWVTLKSNRKHFQEMENMPLMDEEFTNARQPR